MCVVSIILTVKEEIKQGGIHPHRRFNLSYGHFVVGIKGNTLVLREWKREYGTMRLVARESKFSWMVDWQLIVKTRQDENILMRYLIKNC